MPTLHYADDHIICAQYEADVEYVLRKPREKYIKWSLEISNEKTLHGSRRPQK